VLRFAHCDSAHGAGEATPRRRDRVAPFARNAISSRLGAAGKPHEGRPPADGRPLPRLQPVSEGAGRFILPERWLLAEWPGGKDEPVKYWLSNLPADTPLTRLVQLAKLRWRIEHDYRELRQCLGLDHYEGRSYRGLHHHLTCVTVTHAFLTCCRLARPDPDDVRRQTTAA
jgi:hypothetical protein